MTQSIKYSTLRFLLEESRIPIYQRILNAFCAALKQVGCSVIWLRPNEHQSYNEIVNYISSKSIDYCLITNSSGILSDYFNDIDRFVFELFSSKLIFVHHDNLFSHYHDIRMIEKKIHAFQRLNNRSLHFCIEPHNIKDLRSIGINKAYAFHHASEFIPPSKPLEYNSDISFVGHVLPNEYQPLGDEITRNLLLTCYNYRIEAMDSRIEIFANAFASHPDRSVTSPIAKIIYKYWFISAIHMSSQFYRGEIISRIADSKIDIIGGDPAYLSGKEKNRVIHKKGLRYFPPMLDYKNTRSVYSASRINLNITSLQFDDAVINRVIDVCACGGFVLTDSKGELEKLTPLGKEISYKTVDELNTKIDYFLTHEHERIELARQIYNEVNRKCTYSEAINTIFNKIK